MSFSAGVHHHWAPKCPLQCPMSQHFFLSRFQPGWTMGWTSFWPRKISIKFFRGVSSWRSRQTLKKRSTMSCDEPRFSVASHPSHPLSNRASKALHCGGHVSPQRLGFVPGVPWICCAGDANNCII